MKKPTLEEANLHFKNRELYMVDDLDFIISRGGDNWTRERLIELQRLFTPPHLNPSQAYRAKYFPADKPKRVKH